MLETSRENGTLGWAFYGKWFEAWGQQEEVWRGFRVNLKSPILGVHLGPRRCLQRGCWLPPGITGVPRPPASQGRNAKDQLSTELRLPFRGAPGAGPSPAAKSTGSVCPTGRAALAKNSALPIANCARPPGARAAIVEVRAATV